MWEDMRDGRVFMKLGPCEVCYERTLIGNVRTGHFFCTNGCKKSGVVISFRAKQNCFKDIVEKRYSIKITSELSKEQLKLLSKYTGENVVELYKMAKETGITLDEIAYSNLHKVQTFLTEAGLESEIISLLPKIPRFKECWKGVTVCGWGISEVIVE